MTAPSSRQLLKAVATRLEPLLGEIVFVGGCATELLVTDPAAPPVRASDDVDVIVEITSYAEYAKFSARLRKLGLVEDATDAAPICRWRVEGIKLDVMPTDENVLGFSNRWYKSALKEAQTIPFEGLELRVVTPPYFLATKFEAFKGRGRGDFYASKDLEDVITLIDGRPSLLEEVTGANVNVCRYIGGQVASFLASEEFLNALPGHVLGDKVSQARIPRILNTLRSLSELERGRRITSRAGRTPKRRKT